MRYTYTYDTFIYVHGTIHTYIYIYNASYHIYNTQYDTHIHIITFCHIHDMIHTYMYNTSNHIYNTQCDTHIYT